MQSRPLWSAFFICNGLNRELMFYFINKLHNNLILRETFITFKVNM